MAKKKRRNDARLKVIAGGAAPKAVVAKPARAPKAAEPNVRRNSTVERLPAVEEPAYDRVSAVESAPAKPAVAALPRWVVPLGVAAVVGIVAWALLSKSMNPAPPPAAIPPPTAFSASEWPVASQTGAPPPVAVSASVPSTEPMIAPSVSASASSSAIPSVSASAPASAAPSTVPVPSASASAAPKPTKPAAAKPAPAPPSDDPYQ
ncbi:MAG: hypothetical protein ACXVEF_03515 [Polyangiales bacterium]